MKKIAFIYLTLASLLSPVFGDKIKLKNGEILDGKVEKEDEKTVRVRLKTGENKDIPRGTIDEISYSAEPPIRLEKPVENIAKPVTELKGNQVKPIPGWVDGYYRFQTRDGVSISHGKIISETEDAYWVAPNAAEGNTYMISILKSQLLAPPQKTNDPFKAPGSSAIVATKENRNYWEGGRISLQTSYMRDAGWFKMGPYSNNQRGISSVSTHLAYEHSLVNALKVYSMLIPGLRIEATATRINSTLIEGGTVTRPINCCGLLAGDTTPTGIALSGGQMQGGLSWLFPLGNHRIAFSPQMGVSLLNQEFFSTNSSAGFTLSSILGYEYAIGQVSLILNFRISYLDYSGIAPITLMGGGFGLAYHISE